MQSVGKESFHPRTAPWDAKIEETAVPRRTINKEATAYTWVHHNGHIVNMSFSLAGLK